MRSITLPTLSPSHACFLALIALSQRSEFQLIHRINGSLSEEEEAKNEIRREALREARIATIAKYGLQDEYIADAKLSTRKLEIQINSLLAEIRENDAFIKDLEASK